jgi:hypothetical protein
MFERAVRESAARDIPCGTITVTQVNSRASLCIAEG